MTEAQTTENSLKIVRELAAPVDRVWNAFADKALLARWFAPGPLTAKAETYEFRDGGRYRIAMTPPKEGNEAPVPHVAVGTFESIVPKESIVMIWQWEAPPGAPAQPETRLTIRLRPVAQGTELTFLHEGFPDKEAVAQHTEGWTGMLPKLEALLG